MSEMISVAEGFQYSVNIAYDLHADDKLKSYIGYIAPIETVSDREQETLALEAYKAFIGEEEVHKYTSKAVFEGFDL